MLFLLGMNEKNYKVLAVMSGTSLDGVDLAYLNFFKTDYWSYSFLNVETIPYTDFWKNKLEGLVNNDLKSLLEIDVDYTKLLGEIILDFIKKNDIKNIDALCSHGHTALHQPENKITYQIGNQPELANITQLRTVCDFRVQDVLFGGQGAPLVPIGDLLLFKNYSACINLGGFSNISKTINNERVAFDICPVNIVLNYYVSKIDLKYDSNGAIASKGKVSKKLLKQLNQLNYYNLTHPKSLGLEWVKNTFFPIVETYNLSLEDLLCTLVEHAAYQISLHIEGLESVLFTGGGVYNRYLMDRIRLHTATRVVIPDSNLIEFKEALIFGLLGVLKLENEINCLASVTGATKNHSSGKIYFPK